MTMTIPKNWHEILSEEINKPYIADLKEFIRDRAVLGKTIYPPLNQVFNAFSYTPYHEVKIVIIGQDPYHGVNQAHGLSFSVPRGVKIPPSLQNIYKEMQRDLHLPIPTHGNLENWAKQGVLLLNATLTVEAGTPKSHFGQGWEIFTDAVVKKLIERKDPVIFFLWGKSAEAKLDAIREVPNQHQVLIAAHPSPFSAHRFFGCGHFSKANELLFLWGKKPIDWSVD
ncbi:MAG: uracil-DNA glycosylase [Simkaniaceae bacterium]|nr:uracil-DNA glycosylase [Simkaniaceae bacterium]MCF7851838.1 uracil-DNA glycosylase [Simkaniaceae bacterium]